MFLGHYAVGFALKRVAPKTSLGVLVLGAVAADILFGVFLLAGVEHARIAPGFTAVSPFDFYDYPLSHGGVATFVWASAGFFLYYFWPSKNRASRRRGAFVLWGAIVSHYILDVISHIPDIPLLGNDSLKLGLSLWESIPATAAVEGALFLAGVVLYLGATKSTTRQGKWGFVFLVLLLAALSAGNFVSPSPPPNVFIMSAVLIAGQLVLVSLAFWVDGKRVTPDVGTSS